MTERRADIASLAVFRIAFGLVMAAGLVRYLVSGWARIQLVEPEFLFRFYGFGWVPRLPPGWVEPAVAALALLALCVAAGLWYRLTSLVFAAGFAWLQLQDAINYLNHYYLAAALAFLLALLPAHRAWSIDAALRPALRSASVPAWVLWLLRFQVGVVYFYAGVAKLNADWLLHGQPLGIWLAARTDTPVIGPLLDRGWVALALSWSACFFDLTIAGWLSWRRARPYAYAVLLLFHFLTHVFFDIGMFPFIMSTAALVFFDPSWPRALVGLVHRSHRPPAPAVAPGNRMAAALAVAWCVLQASLPVRHHLYGGDLLWTEQGMRFAWKIMLREKSGSVTLHVRDRATGRDWQVSPREYLAWRQANEASAQPDLLLQLAHHAADDFRARGHDVEVRVEAWVSLNGRRPSLLVDPSVDLASVEDGLNPASWILPAPDEAPLALRP